MEVGHVLPLSLAVGMHDQVEAMIIGLEPGLSTNDRCLEVDVPAQECTVWIEELSDSVVIAGPVKLEHDSGTPRGA